MLKKPPDAPILSQGTNQASADRQAPRPASDGSANFDDANYAIGRNV
jgi:hypothetical protein